MLAAERRTRARDGIKPEGGEHTQGMVAGLRCALLLQRVVDRFERGAGRA